VADGPERRGEACSRRVHAGTVLAKAIELPEEEVGQMTKDDARRLMDRVRESGNRAYERYMEAAETPLDRAFNYLYQAFEELQSVTCELIDRMPEEPRREGRPPSMERALDPGELSR